MADEEYESLTKKELIERLIEAERKLAATGAAAEAAPDTTTQGRD